MLSAATLSYQRTAVNCQNVNTKQKIHTKKKIILNGCPLQPSFQIEKSFLLIFNAEYFIEKNCVSIPFRTEKST